MCLSSTWRTWVALALRYGHLNFRNLSDLISKNLVYVLPKMNANIMSCESCLRGKQNSLSFVSYMPKISWYNRCCTFWYMWFFWSLFTRWEKVFHHFSWQEYKNSLATYHQTQKWRSWNVQEIKNLTWEGEWKSVRLN